MSSESDNVSSLPRDVIELQILTRLPIKSLCKFRCVSKPWNSLLHSPRFAKLHVTKALENPSQQSVLISASPFYFIDYDDIDDLDDDSDPDNKVIQWQKPHPLFANTGPFKAWYVVGECNGLVCVAVANVVYITYEEKRHTRKFCLWNPSLGDCKEICQDDVVELKNKDDARCMFGNESTDKIRFDVYGFGYDSVVDDYKIVRVVGYESRRDVVEMEIYTVGSNTWRKMEVQLAGCSLRVPHRRFTFTPNCAFVNGSCHWIMDTKTSKKLAILSFNMESEKLEQVVPLPDLKKLSDLMLQLSVVSGKLWLMTRAKSSLDIWVLKIYGERASWTQEATLVAKDDKLLPICFSRKGDLLVCADENRVMKFDPNTKAYTKGTLFMYRCQPIMYTKSLVSPFRISNIDGNL